ncbi:MAG: TrpR like protein, YerC/YecD [Candidatus Roizmanbacteria bacterium GW2011_GWC2_41_7]|uniref:TrpR like protein, YerC/YecD n=1 Tax=Candidatus Roizmanbacteria bacterium GW2011_GWC2_41_7 TaxID=1618487 RepID=A0A0G0X4J4_9BACT|nr:MAG: TrpR like protein, YerC/YecD [Candidatus Roizmanbacteria bacterium GW2011_GWC2_41_7]
MNNKWINKNTDALFTAVLQLETLDETRRFFRDLLTEQEILEFANRWKVAPRRKPV